MVNIYDDASSGIKLYIFVIINIYTSITPYVQSTHYMLFI